MRPAGCGLFLWPGRLDDRIWLVRCPALFSPGTDGSLRLCIGPGAFGIGLFLSGCTLFPGVPAGTALRPGRLCLFRFSRFPGFSHRVRFPELSGGRAGGLFAAFACLWLFLEPERRFFFFYGFLAPAFAQGVQGLGHGLFGGLPLVVGKADFHLIAGFIPEDAHFGLAVQQGPGKRIQIILTVLVQFARSFFIVHLLPPVSPYGVILP